MQKNFKARDTVERFNVFLSAKIAPRYLKISSVEHAKPLFIVFRLFNKPVYE